MIWTKDMNRWLTLWFVIVYVYRLKDEGWLPLGYGVKVCLVPQQDQLNMKSGHREFLYINKTKIQCKETQFINT